MMLISHSGADQKFDRGDSEATMALIPLRT